MSFEAVVLAGGRGTRLAPFTHVLPKPLLPVHERPVLDIVLCQLRRDGCQKVTLAVGHLGHLIEVYCGAGERWDIEIDYFREQTPLGTVGALAHIDSATNRSLIVMNGDVLTDLSFPVLLDAHVAVAADLTIAGFVRGQRDEFGVLAADPGGRVTAYHEKPEHQYLVSMGIYVLGPSAIEAIPGDEPMDFPDLVGALLEAGRHVHTHVHSGYWLDLGRPDDFARANEEFRSLEAFRAG